MIRAAGILLAAPGGLALFLKRSPQGDHAGEWCFPGGRVEEGESTLQAAERETKEEAGWLPEGERSIWTRTISSPSPTVVPSSTPQVGGAAGDEVDFTTFLQKIESPFVPTLNEEHVGYAWAPIDAPPEPLHPGCRVALDRFGMDELGVARAIADGRLASPQRYLNVSLYAMRITGTGVAYRSKINEFVYRRPEYYLTPDFLARCNGLPVIWIHPKKAVLNSKEFSDRVVGSMMLPYVQGDEVWGVAKVYDDDAIKWMSENPMSTSPGVVLMGTDTKMELEDGSTLLIEDAPRLLDHLAICERGVWDKGGEPAGITVRGDQDMTEAEMRAAAEAKLKLDAEVKARVEAELKARADADEKARDDRSKADAEAGEKLDKMLTHLDSISKRVDGFEEEMKKDKKDADEDDDKDEKEKADKAKKDADEKEMFEKEKADKAKKDADEKEKADAKADADAKAKADSNIAQQIKDLAARMPKQITDADYHALADAQARADEVFNTLGARAPRPLDGETLLGYRRRLAEGLKPHSKVWKNVDLVSINDAALTIAEGQIYADATAAGLSPADLPEGELRAITRRDPTTGQQMTTFHGSSTFIKALGRPSRRVVGIGVPRDQR